MEVTTSFFAEDCDPELELSLENEFINVKIERDELKLQLSVRNQCVVELKQKIQQQQLELQNSSQNNKNLAHSLDSLTNELLCVKKSENWYRQQFHQLQTDKSNILKSKLGHERRLRLEVNSLKLSFREIQQALANRITELKKLSSQLQTELNVRNKDNETLEISVKAITQQFKLLKSNYRHLKCELDKMKQERDKHERCSTAEYQVQILQNAAKSQSLCKLVDKNLETLPQIFVEHLSRPLNYIDIFGTELISYNYNANMNSYDLWHFNGLTILRQFITYIHRNSAIKYKYVASPTKNYKELKKQARARLKKLDGKCELLKERIRENALALEVVKDLRSNNSKLREDVRNLQTLLQVKDRETNEKQLRYHRNYRILLRKVAEEIKVRKEVEKHNLRLQETNSSLLEECNSIKLQVGVTDAEIKRKEKLLAICENINETLKSTVEKYENDKANYVNTQAQQISNNFPIDYNSAQEDVGANEECLTNCSYDNERGSVDNSCLRDTTEEAEDVLECNLTDVVTNLTKELDSCKSKMFSINSEKFFLQRLCNDLKSTLSISINQNRALQRVMKDMWTNNNQFNVPNFLANFPPAKCDDSYIDVLLQKARSCMDQSVSENEDYFKTLNKEMLGLQRRIQEKYIFR